MLKWWCEVCKIVCGVILFVACKPGVPSGLIQPSELEDLLYDYHVAQAMAEMERDSVNYKRYEYVQSVFIKHGVSEAEFDSTMIWYSAHANYLNDIYRNLKERFTVQAAASGTPAGSDDVFANLNEQGDTANIWHERPFRVLKPYMTEDRLHFSMEADSAFRRGDDILWRFDARYVGRGRQSEAYAGFYIRFDNDSTVGTTLRIHNNGQMQLRLGGDSVHSVREIGGFVYFKLAEEEKEPRLLIMSDIMLVRMHKQQMRPDTTAILPDSIDVLPVGDSVRMKLPADTVARRLSPDELREGRQVKHTIDVVKEKPYRIVNRKGTMSRKQTKSR